ncbi:hypothetical protein AAY473_020123 [Plecturocebus cupreus]
MSHHARQTLKALTCEVWEGYFSCLEKNCAVYLVSEMVCSEPSMHGWDQACAPPLQHWCGFSFLLLPGFVWQLELGYLQCHRSRLFRLRIYFLLTVAKVGAESLGDSLNALLLILEKLWASPASPALSITFPEFCPLLSSCTLGREKLRPQGENCGLLRVKGLNLSTKKVILNMVDTRLNRAGGQMCRRQAGHVDLGWTGREAGRVDARLDA